MVNRTEKQLEQFIEDIDRVWSLSLNEMDILGSFLNLLLAGKNTEIKKIVHLLNDETEELLKSLDKEDIKDYAEDYLAMVEKDDIEDCDDCKKLHQYDDDCLLDECDSRGLKWQDYERIDIVAQSDLDEMTELFLNLSPQKRSEIINNLK